ARTTCSSRRLPWVTAPTPARGPSSARTFHQVPWPSTWHRNATYSAGCTRSVQARPPPVRLRPQVRIHLSSPKGTPAHERPETRDREEPDDLLRPVQPAACRRGGLPARDQPGADLGV